MNDTAKSPDVAKLLRSMGTLKKQLSTEVRKLNQGRRSDQDVNQLFELLRSDGELLEQLLARRRGQSPEGELDFDLADIVDLYRCYVCEEPVTAALWEPDPTKIRCLMCRDD